MKNKPKKDYSDSPATVEQVDIYNTKFNLVRILVIRALAGTGKTTTLIEIAKQNPHIQYLYIALNKSIIIDVENAVRKAVLKNVKVKTVHALAYESSAVYRSGRDIQKITVDFVKKYLNINDSFKAYSIISMFEDYCSQSSGFQDFSDYTLSKVDHKNVSVSRNLNKQALNGVQSLLEGFENGSIDFITHGLYLKYFIDNQSLITEDCLMVDESQDLNDAMFSFIESQIELGVKNIIAVGDQNQSIYGFIGSRDIMSILKEKYGAVVKTLTRSFRFAAKSEMESFANQFLSLRGETIYGAALHSDCIVRNNAYLGRTNMQIIGKCINLIKNGEEFSLLGGIKSIDFESILDVWYLNQIKNDASKADKIKSDIIKSFDSKGALKAWAVENDFSEYVGACNAVDQMYTWLNDSELNKVIEECGFVREKIPFPKKIFNLIDGLSKKSSHTIVSTFHKSKGLGVDRVEIMGYSESVNEDRPVLPYGLLQDRRHRGSKVKLIDDLYISNDGQEAHLLKLDPKQRMLFDEYNLMYVAVTRAKKEMFVHDQRVVASANFISKLYTAFAHNDIIMVEKDKMKIECFSIQVYINSQLSVKYFVPKSVASEFLGSIQKRKG